jgi:hypothetical protein
MKNSIVFLLTISSLIIVTGLCAQKVISAGGGGYESEQFSVNWTVGEPVIETFIANNVVLTQGFHQPFNFYITQLLNIATGWSGISAYVEPLNTNVENIFTPFDNNFIILSSLSQYYYPAGGVNSIIDWNTQTGYQIKTISGFDLSLTGTKINDLSINLSAGWNLIPVLTSCGALIEESLGTVGGSIIVKDVAGTGVYWPQYGISTLTGLSPGKAYWVAMSNPGSFTYPNCNSKRTPIVSVAQDIVVPESWGELAKTASSHVIAFPFEALKIAGLKQGVIIGAFTSENQLAGISQIDHQAPVGLTVFGDEHAAANKNGFSQGEVLKFKVFDPQLKDERWLEVEYDHTLPNSDYFVNNGLSAVKSISGVAFSTNHQHAFQASLYPNPSDGNFLVTMSKWPPDLLIVLTDSRGQTIRTFFPENQTVGSSLTFQLANLTSGIYFLELTSAEYREVKKLIIK